MAEWNQKHVALAILLVGIAMSAAVFNLNTSVAEIGKKLDDTNSKLSGLAVAQAAAQAPSQQPTQAAAPAQQQAQPPAKQDVKLSGHVLKGAAGSVQIVEFSDFQCPFCKAAEPTVQQILKDYGSKVTLSYYHFPLPFHQNARIAALAAECAGQQGDDKFWALHDKMFTVGQSDGTNLDQTSLTSYAKTLGLDMTKFNACLTDSKTGAKVDADAAYGQQLGVSGTPTFYINGVQLVGAQPYSAFKQAIDAALAG